MQHYKGKYQDYKVKLRKANANIATLSARIAKFDIELAAEREDRPEGVAPNAWQGDQLQELLANDGLNEEIRKLLAETGV